MNKQYQFGKTLDVNEDFFYVLSLITKSNTVFRAERDCIANSYNDQLGEWDYISILTKEKYPQGTTFSTRCSFESYGAPLLVFSDDITRAENGRNYYGLHFEIVAYEQGCNVWKITPDQHAPNDLPIRMDRIGFLEFPISDGSIIDLSVQVKDGAIHVRINGREFSVTDPDLPQTFHVGLTACEGVNRFYDFQINSVKE